MENKEERVKDSRDMTAFGLRKENGAWHVMTVNIAGGKCIIKKSVNNYNLAIAINKVVTMFRNMAFTESK